MFIVTKEDGYGCEYGVNVEDVIGPFTDRAAAEAFADRANKAGLYATFFKVRCIRSPEKELAYLSDFAGKVI